MRFLSKNTDLYPLKMSKNTDLYTRKMSKNTDFFVSGLVISATCD